MREYEDLPYIVIERRSGGASAFLWGALLGAGAALLLAPRSGVETQEELRARARRARTAAEDRVYGVRDAVTGTVTRTRDRLQDRLDSVRTEIESRAEQARHAVDAGRQAARDARSELERRVAEAKDTYRAASDSLHPEPRPVVDELIITEVVVEEAEGRPDLG